MRNKAVSICLSLLVVAGCHRAVDDTVPNQVSPAPASAPAPSVQLTIVSVDPPSAKIGQTFNVQKNGRSAFGLVTTGASPTTKIYCDSAELETTYGNPAFVTAYAPAGITASAGTHTISLRDGSRTSADVQWVVSP